MAGEVRTQGTELYVATGGTTVVKIGNIPNIDGIGGSSNDIDVTNFDSAAMEFLQGLSDEGTLNSNINWAITDTSHDALWTLKGSKERVWWIVCLSGSDTAPTAVDGVIVPPAARGSFRFEAVVQQIQINLAANDVIRASLGLRLSNAILYDNGQGS